MVLQDPGADVGAKNERRISAICAVPGTSGFEVSHGWHCSGAGRGWLPLTSAKRSVMPSCRVRTIVCKPLNTPCPPILLLHARSPPPRCAPQQIHGLVDRLMTIFGLSRQPGTLPRNDATPAVAGGQYSFAHSEHPSFLPGRQAKVFVNRLTVTGEPIGVKPLGVFGVVHPEVLGSFELPFPASALELDMEVLL